jgi:LPS-assembly protein
VALGDHWRAGSYLEWDTTTNELDVANFQFQFQSDINRILNLGYRLREMPGPGVVNGIKRRIDQTDISGIWPINDRWGLIARWNHDLANNRNLEAIAGVEYSNCCWTVRVLARQWIDNNALFEGLDDDNRGIFVQFELKGLGSLLGSNVTGILNNGIRGYRERDYVQ